ncbi:MAG: hypothetical protein AAF623_08450, partial [Planctomycetota bacterium]
ISCPDLILPARILGSPDSIQLAMEEGSHLQVKLKLQLMGDSLKGDISFQHSQAEFEVTQIHELAGGEKVLAQMNRGLKNLSSFVSNVSIKGKLGDYSMNCETDFGQKFAERINYRLTAQSESMVSQWQTQLQRVFDAKMKTLDEQLIPRFEELTSQFKQEKSNVAGMAPAKRSR